MGLNLPYTHYIKTEGKMDADVLAANIATFNSQFTELLTEAKALQPRVNWSEESMRLTANIARKLLPTWVSFFLPHGLVYWAMSERICDVISEEILKRDVARNEEIERLKANVQILEMGINTLEKEIEAICESHSEAANVIRRIWEITDQYANPAEEKKEAGIDVEKFMQP